MFGGKPIPAPPLPMASRRILLSALESYIAAKNFRRVPHSPPGFLTRLPWGRLETMAEIRRLRYHSGDRSHENRPRPVAGRAGRPRGSSWHDSSDTQTSLSLMERLRQFPWNTEAWERFVELYRPKIYGWCRAWGLQAGGRGRCRAGGDREADTEDGEFRL